MSRRAYEDDGTEEEWNTVADPAFDPNNGEYTHTESPARRGRKARGGGGKRGRSAGGTGGGRGTHPDGEFVAVTPRARSVVSNMHVMSRPLEVVVAR